MSNLVAITFEDQKTAFDMRAKLVELQSEYLIEMDDVVVVTRDAEGKVKLHQAVNLTATGAVGGSFWGMLIGMLFLNPLVGLAAGAGSGALAGWLSDAGINDQFMKDLGSSLTPGGAAIFVMVRKSTPDKVMEALSAFQGKGKVLQTSLSKDSDEALRAFIEKMPEA